MRYWNVYDWKKPWKEVNKVDADTTQDAINAARCMENPFPIVAETDARGNVLFRQEHRA